MRRLFGQSRALAGIIPRQRNNAGFSVPEMVVSLAIIMLVSAQVVVSFSGLGQGVTLNRAAQELVTQLRNAQYMPLAVAYAHVPVSGVPGFKIPPRFGMRFNTSVPDQAILFADRGNSTDASGNPTDLEFPSPPNPDGKYTGDIREFISTYTLPWPVKINRILDDHQPIPNTYSAVHILFLVPEASLLFTKDDGSAFPGNKVDIELKNGIGVTKTVTVWITGQINVK